MTESLNSPRVTNPYIGPDGELTYLKLQEDAVKNAEALTQLHKNERILGQAPIDPDVEYKNKRNIQDTSVREQARIAAGIIDAILMNPNMPPEVIAKLKDSRGQLTEVANGGGIIGSSDALMTIMSMVGEAYAAASQALIATAAETSIELARAANAIAVHRAVERQRANGFYPDLNDNDWSRIEILSSVVTPKNIDKFAEAVFADDARTPPSLRASHAKNFVTYGTTTQTGKELIETHNTLSMVAPEEKVQSNAQLEQQNKDIDALLKKGGLSPELENTLKQVRTSRIFSAPLMEQINAYKKSSDPAIQQKIIDAGTVVIDQRLNEDLPRLKEIARTVGLTEEQLKQRYGIGYGDTINAGNRDKVLRGLEDVHKNVRWLTHPASEEDRARNAAAEKVCAQWDKLKAEGKSDKEINKTLLDDFGPHAVSDASDKKAHAVLTAAGKVENANDSTMDKALGEKVEAAIKVHGTEDKKKLAEALTAELKNDPKYCNMDDKKLSCFCADAVDAVQNQNKVEAVCKGGHCKIVHKQRETQEEQKSLTSSCPHTAAREAAKEAAGVLVACGTQVEKTAATAAAPAAQLTSLTTQRPAPSTTVCP